MSHYKRVIPRDLFNEAKLLKCIGAFILEADGLAVLRKGIELPDEGEPFNVVQCPLTGALSISNYQFSFGGLQLDLFTEYNSKANYPLWAEIDQGEQFLVLDESGKITPELLAALIKAYLANSKKVAQ